MTLASFRPPGDDAGASEAPDAEPTLHEVVAHAAWGDHALFLWRSRPWDASSLVPPDTLEDAAPGARGRKATLSLVLPDNGRLAPRKVCGVCLDPFEALLYLARLPETDDPGLGPDLRLWSRAAKLALELLARQRFAPSIREHNGRVEALWRLVLDDPRDAERLRWLAEAMPDACRAAEPRRTRRALLLDFLAAVVDAAVRAFAPLRDDVDGDDAVDRWLAALTNPEDARVQGSPVQLRILREEVDAWTAHLGDGEAPFRTCFRLEEPSGEGTRWHLAFEVQASDDPSLRVPAADVWRGTRFLRRRFPGAPERLLADLGRAARLFPPIEAALRRPTPRGCPLSAAEAHRFLREATPLFEECGFGILIPPWWRDRRQGLSLRVTVRPASREAGQGFLGLHSLVAFDWEAALGDQRVSVQELERLARLKLPLVRVRGQWVELRPGDVARALEALRAREEATTVADALQLLASREVGLPVSEVRGTGWVAELLEARFAEIPPPAGLRAELRPYQRRGLAWLGFLRTVGLGACLADDMGLGKTVQVLALLLAVPRAGPALVVCPTSVLGNWEQEIARFAPSLRVRTHHGADRRGRLEDADVVLTSYGTALRDASVLARTAWDTLVLDEAQNVKNAEAKQAKAVRSFPARFRVALTGTPVENRLADLWSIFEAINPGYLGPAETFRRTWAIPIERYQDPERTDALRRLVRPLLLRRMKTDPTVIRDLPEKIETREFCTLMPEQGTLYRAVVDDMVGQIETAEGIRRRGLILTALLKLKQVCNHPAQFLGDGSPFEGRSGKVARLDALLEEVLAEGARALLFTQFTGMADLLVPHLQRRFGCEVLYLHGGTPPKARRTTIARFQSPDGPPLFVLSLKAGGTGLNLTAANHVFHVDRWWNPAVEDQATDRAFRIGQTRSVHVHKFVCRGTVEERIDALIESKKALAGSIVGTGEAWLTELSTEELRSLFALREHAVEGIA